MPASPMSRRSNHDFNNVQSSNKKAKIGSIPNDEVNAQETDNHEDSLLARRRTHSSISTTSTATTLWDDGLLNASFGPSSAVPPLGASVALVKGGAPEGKQESGDDAAVAGAGRGLLATSHHEKIVQFFTSNVAWCATSHGRPEDAKNWLKFPLKMMYALECGDYNDILSWNVDGTSFNIHNAKLFEEKVLPEVFKEAKFASFRRKLNRWAFKRERTRKQFIASHPMFRRGELALCSMIACADSANKRSTAEFSIPPGGPYVNQIVVAAPQNSSFVNHCVTIPQLENATLLHNAGSREVGNLRDTRFINAAPFNAFTNQMSGMPQSECLAPHTLRDMNAAASISDPFIRMLPCTSTTSSHERGFGNRNTMLTANFDRRADQALFGLTPQGLQPMPPPGLQTGPLPSSNLASVGLREQVAMNSHNNTLNMIDPQMHPNARRFASNEVSAIPAAHQYHFVPGAGLQVYPPTSIALDPPPPNYHPTIPALNDMLSLINHSQARSNEQLNLRNRNQGYPTK